MAAHQAPLSLGFSRQEYCSGLPFPSPMHVCLLSRFSSVQLYATPRTAAHQAPLSTGFSRQEYWSGLPFPSPMYACMLSHFSCVQPYVTPWTAAHQAPLSTGFSRQEYWRGLPRPPPGDLPDSGIKPLSLMSPELAGGFFTTEPRREALRGKYSFKYRKLI